MKCKGLTMPTLLDSNSSSVMVPILDRKAGTLPVNCSRKQDSDQSPATARIRYSLVTVKCTLMIPVKATLNAGQLLLSISHAVR